MMRVAVAGAGVIGASAALALSNEGFDVTLFEAASVGEGSTARAAGVLSEVTWDDEDRIWVAESRTLYEHPPGGGPSLFRRTGSLTFADHRGDLEEASRRLSRARTEYEFLTDPGWARRFPAFRVEPASFALYVPGDGVASGGDYARLAALQLRERGRSVRPHTAVRFGEPRAGAGVPVTLPEGETRMFDRVLLAAGAHTARLADPLGVHLPLRSYRTQLVRVEHPQGDGLPPFVVHDLALAWYWVPESQSGAYLMGDGTEHTESDPESYRSTADESFLQSVAERLDTRTLGGREARLGRAWAGLCTATPDRRPLLGPIPGHPDVWVASGMNGFGVMRGPSIGRAVARAIAQDDPTGIPALCRTDRPGLSYDTVPVFPIREGYTLLPK